jgi:hypothetical protein
MKKFILFLLLLLIKPYCLFSQEKKIPAESSETWMNNQHQSEKLMDAIGLKEGMTIADIRASRRRMTVWFADRVGDKGEVYSDDIDRGALEYLEHRCQENNIRNVKTILRKVDEAGFELIKVNTKLLERDNIYFFKVKI